MSEIKTILQLKSEKRKQYMYEQNRIDKRHYRLPKNIQEKPSQVQVFSRHL